MKSNQNNFSDTGANELHHNNKQVYSTRPDEQNIEQRRAVHESSKVNQDNRFEKWKRRIDENDPSQTNEAGYTINTISTETTVTGDSGFYFRIKIEGIETKALTDTGTNMTKTPSKFEHSSLKDEHRRS